MGVAVGEGPAGAGAGGQRAPGFAAVGRVLGEVAGAERFTERAGDGAPGAAVAGHPVAVVVAVVLRHVAEGDHDVGRRGVEHHGEVLHGRGAAEVVNHAQPVGPVCGVHVDVLRGPAQAGDAGGHPVAPVPELEGLAGGEGAAEGAADFAISRTVAGDEVGVADAGVLLHPVEGEGNRLEADDLDGPRVGEAADEGVLLHRHGNVVHAVAEGAGELPLPAAGGVGGDAVDGLTVVVYEHQAVGQRLAGQFRVAVGGGVAVAEPGVGGAAVVERAVDDRSGDEGDGPGGRGLAGGRLDDKDVVAGRERRRRSPAPSAQRADVGLAEQGGAVINQHFGACFRGAAQGGGQVVGKAAAGHQAVAAHVVAHVGNRRRYAHHHLLNERCGDVASDVGDAYLIFPVAGVDVVIVKHPAGTDYDQREPGFAAVGRVLGEVAGAERLVQ